ncbi:unnamed protein product [Pieris macdunnoughi]|uniref:Uncharacterized protein n=1 Tax=Pieris macdunnoughi TaxID=345717 RepID=A0A821R318_9NEOP|nr:unnamed protein product [Pieris macdunnoughi]
MSTEVNSDVTKRHNEPIKSRFYPHKFGQLTASPAPVRTEKSTRDFRATETDVCGKCTRVRGISVSVRGGAVGGRQRMMYRVVELGSNCVGKWPRLESVRTVPRVVSPLKTVFNTSIFYAIARI